MKTFLKICGVTRLEDALLLDALQVDFLGFIFYPLSKRAITKEHAKYLRFALQYTKPIGVFVDESPEIMSQIAEELDLWGIQSYHTPVNLVTCKNRKKIQAVTAIDHKNMNLLIHDAFEHQADYVLLDTFHANKLGGTGETFPWEWLPNERSRLFLAGGIGPENFQEALSCQTFAIDMNSKLEIAPGVKDQNKIKKVVEKMKSFL